MDSIVELLKTETVPIVGVLLAIIGILIRYFLLEKATWKQEIKEYRGQLLELQKSKDDKGQENVEDLKGILEKYYVVTTKFLERTRPNGDGKY
jgi:hypothetical protein